MINFLQSLIDGLGGIFIFVSNLLPPSPFNKFNELSIDATLLSNLAWFIPLPQIVATLEAWLAAVAAFRVYLIILRFIRAIN